MRIVFVLVFAGSLVFDRGISDQFHYNNVLLGERAQGLGGAFCAISDDASGVVYNPAGVAFSLSNDISGSANAFYSKKVTYKKTIGTKDFVENSTGTLAPFVGALGKLDHLLPGLVWAFGIYQTDSELKDQDDLIEESTSLRFHRTSNIRANTNKYGAVLAKRFGSSFSLGFGLGVMMIDELIQEYQDARTLAIGAKYDTTGAVVKDEDGNIEQGYYFQYLNQNIRQRLTATALDASLGMQLAFGGRFSWGLMIRVPTILHQSYETAQESTVSYYSIDADKVINNADTGISGARNHRSLFDDEEKGAIVIPMEVRTGMAYFASTNLLLSMDLAYYGEADGEKDIYDRDAIMNYHFGAEYYLNPSVPVRFGLFTNNDSRPALSKSKLDQRDHVDYTGASLFVAMVQPNSQIALGYVHQIGVGESQKIAGSSKIQDIEATSSTVGFSVSHNF